MLTEYEASQRQRQIERNIRKYKREYLALDAAGKPTDGAAAKLAKWQSLQKDFIKQTGMKRQYNRERVDGFSRGEAAKTVKNILTNSAGQRIIKVRQSDVSLQGEPNTITQTESRKGGINRNYYDNNGRQIKQISNNHHNHKPVMGYGDRGEHAHDYIYKDDKLVGRPHRELSEDERKENQDIL